MAFHDDHCYNYKYNIIFIGRRFMEVINKVDVFMARYDVVQNNMNTKW